MASVVEWTSTLCNFSFETHENCSLIIPHSITNCSKGKVFHSYNFNLPTSSRRKINLPRVWLHGWRDFCIIMQMTKLRSARFIPSITGLSPNWVDSERMLIMRAASKLSLDWAASRYWQVMRKKLETNRSISALVPFYDFLRLSTPLRIHTFAFSWVEQ